MQHSASFSSGSRRVPVPAASRNGRGNVGTNRSQLELNSGFLISTNFFHRNVGSQEERLDSFEEDKVKSTAKKTGLVSSRGIELQKKQAPKVYIIALILVGVLVVSVSLASRLITLSRNSKNLQSKSSQAETRPTSFPTLSITLAPIATSSSPTSSPTTSPTQPLFPDEFRIGNNYIGLYLLSELGEEPLNAFINAVNRWSSIVGGTFGAYSAKAPAGFNFCGTGKLFPTAVTVNHLIIGARVAYIDGVNGILGQSGPCNTVNGFPALGLMSFDTADISQLIASQTLVSVILHEMGHVLGIGTLFSSKGLLHDAVLQSNGTKISKNQPKFTGPTAVSFYSQLTAVNTTYVPVENGIVGGINMFPTSSGSGSIDSHWDEDFVPGELMDYRIRINNGVQPSLSLITIGCLKDLGYTVDFSYADDYSVLGSRVSAEDLVQVEMLNDVRGFEIIEGF